MPEPKTKVEVVTRANLFKTKLLEKCQAHHDENFKNSENTIEIVLEVGKRYIRVVHQSYSNHRSAHCFIDMNNGNILKCNGWKAPHPTPRGNIFAEDVGMSCVGPYGAAYLRG